MENLMNKNLLLSLALACVSTIAFADQEQQPVLTTAQQPTEAAKPAEPVPTVPPAPEFSEAPGAPTTTTQPAPAVDAKPQTNTQQPQAPEITEAEFEKLITELIQAQEEKKRQQQSQQPQQEKTLKPVAPQTSAEVKNSAGV